MFMSYCLFDAMKIDRMNDDIHTTTLFIMHYHYNLLLLLEVSLWVLFCFVLFLWLVHNLAVCWSALVHVMCFFDVDC